MQVQQLSVRRVQLIHPVSRQPLIRTDGKLVDSQGGEIPNVNGVYRFVSGGNYTESFGFQWNKFQRTQIDHESQVSQSYERFFAVTGWDREDLSGQNVLEVGSGAGRFTQVVLDHTWADLYSVDYSNAVEANYRNNGHHGERLQLFQASVYELPFAPASFDKVFCFGVLQHTPDFRKSVECLAQMVRPGGELVVDFYPINGWWTKIHAKYMLRPFTRKMSHGVLLEKIERNADRLIATYRLLDRVGLGALNRFVPVCGINGTLPPGLNREQLREWVILDTFDMFSPEYDQPQRVETVRRWFEEAGMKTTFAGHIQYGPNHYAAVVKGLKEAI
jgi:SAM-dependent methyltransferase